MEAYGPPTSTTRWLGLSLGCVPCIRQDSRTPLLLRRRDRSEFSAFVIHIQSVLNFSWGGYGSEISCRELRMRRVDDMFRHSVGATSATPAPHAPPRSTRGPLHGHSCIIHMYIHTRIQPRQPPHETPRTGCCYGSGRRAW